MQKLRQGGTVLVGVAIIAAFLVVPVHAQSSQTIAQEYQVKGDSGDYVAGALVTVQQGNVQSAELATQDTADRLLGVVGKDSLLVISATNAKVEVVLNGTAVVLASDINGAIKSGDKIAPSPIPGVGMAATTSGNILGTAQADLDISKSKTKTIQDNAGVSHEVHIGYVPVQIGITFYQETGSSLLPPFIQDIANTVAGRPVALIRVLLGTTIALFGMVSIAIFIYSSVRSAMLSLGRNPLAAHNIRKSIYQVSVLAVAFLAATLLISYLIIAL
jgi:hypothetical protein